MDYAGEVLRIIIRLIPSLLFYSPVENEIALNKYSAKFPYLFFNWYFVFYSEN